LQTPEEILKQYFGYDNFRPLQKDIVMNAIEGRDTIALLPTGGGKSICFQVPALMKKGVCLVVTPLIALMKDQVENLRNRDIMAIALYSGMSRKEIEFELENCINGKYKFLYVSPERLLSKHFIDYALNIDLNFIAIDEAHCISQWGYDFRPPYLQIAEFKAKFDKIVTIALTASATPEVVKDIEKKLELRKPQIFTQSFTRKNLSYVVQREENKFEKIISICQKLKGTGLVYVKSRKKTTRIAEMLKKKNISADDYHAGLEAKLRTQKQDDWKQGRTRIMVCTNAFGMGIDKGEVRFVIHEQKPDTLEAYYQEAGRAGRDGEKSYCILLHHASDDLEDARNIESKYPSTADISRVYELICNYLQVAVGSGQGTSYNLEINELCTYFGVSPSLVFNALKILESEAYFQTTESIYTPSRMKILCSYQELYEWQLKHESIDSLFKMILRSYGGMFDFYTNLYEYEIAARLKKPEKWVREQLAKLHGIGLVDYVPQNTKPQIVFLENRFPTVYVSNEKIEFLRSRYREKLAHVNAFIHNTTVCRSSQLVSYFGEKNAADCGICDICLSKKPKANTTYEQYFAKINHLFKSGSFRIEDIGKHVSPGEINEYLFILRWLKDNGYLVETKEGPWQWRKEKKS
jgi:ATP-dependent DNA helicase RecQ